VSNLKDRTKKTSWFAKNRKQKSKKKTFVTFFSFFRAQTLGINLGEYGWLITHSTLTTITQHESSCESKCRFFLQQWQHTKPSTVYRYRHAQTSIVTIFVVYRC
jgi:hypothetical protein